MGHKKFWKFHRNVWKEDLRSFQGGMQENCEFGSRISNIAQKKLSKYDNEVLKVE